jgi:ketosteroid isomerase-like protein
MICSKAMTEADETERAVLAANARFYRAFSEGDFAAMSELWASRSPVACLHPGDSLLVGLQQVLRRWREILAPGPAFVLRCDKPIVQAFGTMAIVYCYEGVNDEPAHLVATNVFVREGEGWHMAHHHAGPLANPLPDPRAANLN